MPAQGPSAGHACAVLPRRSLTDFPLLQVPGANMTYPGIYGAGCRLISSCDNGKWLYAAFHSFHVTYVQFGWYVLNEWRYISCHMVTAASDCAGMIFVSDGEKYIYPDCARIQQHARLEYLVCGKSQFIYGLLRWHPLWSSPFKICISKFHLNYK